jgi:hypothetical protein
MELRAGSWSDVLTAFGFGGKEEGGGPSSSSMSESLLELGDDSSVTSEHGTWTP